MNIECIVTGAYQENCYLLWNDNQQALVIDPGDNADHLIEHIKKKELNVIGYLCTHAHADHICALHNVHKQYPAPIGMHHLDWSWAFDEINQSPPYYEKPQRPDCDDYLDWAQHSSWEFDTFSFEIIHTPGHTPGSCTLYFPSENIAFVGDTLFKGSCGRTDLPGGNSVHLKESLRLLKKLPANTDVYSGHGDSTTLQHENETNFYMQ